MASATLRSQLRASLPIIAFVLLWSGLTLAFDIIGLWGAVCQVRATSYSRVPGQMVKCELEIEHGEGTTYRIEAEYAYLVAGAPCHGTRLRYGFGHPSREFNESFVRGHPPGQPVEVWYDPGNPSESLLEPGIAGCDLFMGMFLMPFNVVTLGMLLGLLARARFGATGGVRVRDDGISLRLAVAGWKPVHAAVLAAAAASFVLAFAVGFPTGMDPSLAVAGGAWGGVLCCAAAAWFWARRRAPAIAGDLVINRTEETLTLPACGDRRTPLIIPWSSIENVTVEARGDAKIACHVPLVIIAAPDGKRMVEAVTEPQAAWVANSLAGLIRKLVLDKRWAGV